MNNTSKAISDVFKEHGRVFTSTRARIYQILEHASSPMTTKDVWEVLVGDSGHKPDLATVYRTLTAMVELGMVRKIAHGRNVSMYETSLSDCHSHRVVCQHCGSAQTLPCAVLLSLASSVEASSGYSVAHQSMDILGCCPRCRHQAEPDSSTAVES